jgi:putative transcriptional regulator
MLGGNIMTKNWNIYIARNEAKQSQGFVAKKLGISPQRYHNPTIPEAKILSELYGMTLDELFGNEIKIGS